MIRKTVAALALLGLVACSSGAPAPPPPVASAGPPPPPPPSRSGRDQCGASDLAYLVGKSRGDIPVPVDPSLRRVACTTCPVTMDFNPRRLNILFDADTGIIRQVKCG